VSVAFVTMWFACLLSALAAAQAVQLATALPAAPRCARSHMRLLALRGGELDDVLPPVEPLSDIRPMEEARVRPLACNPPREFGYLEWSAPGPFPSALCSAGTARVDRI